MAIDFAIWIKLMMGFLGFVYVIYILLKVEKVSLKSTRSKNWKGFWISTFPKFVIIAFITFLYVWLTNKNQLFIVIRTKPFLWLAILFVYTLLSVYPQEILYRTFFFQRYKVLIQNDKIFIFLNAIIFAFGHLFFKNVLVIVLTFLGGLLFAMTYNKSKSTLMVSVEHAIYGCWLFTVGMGTMLGFPS